MDTIQSVSQFIKGELKGNKCAAFDLDGTILIGKRLYPNIKEKLEDLVRRGYNIIIFSNQLRPRQSDNLILSKMNALSELKFPLHFFFSREDDNYRKPNTGMIELVPKHYGQIEFYVGDAAGRRGDHSNCDLEFAKNANLPFYTPEQFLMKFSSGKDK